MAVGAAAHPERAVNTAAVVHDGLRAQAELGRDLRVRPFCCDRGEDLRLSLGQLGVRARPSSTARGDGLGPFGTRGVGTHREQAALDRRNGTGVTVR